VANRIITPSVIAKRALATLFNTTVFAGLVYRDYDPDFAGKQGDTVTIRTPAQFTAQDFSGSITLQDIREGNLTATLSHHADVSFPITAKELTLQIDDLAERVINPAMEAIVQKVDGDIASEALAMAVNGGDTQAITAATTDIITCVKHGFHDGDKVVFPSLTGGAGLTAGTTVFFVINSTQDTFKVSTTLGGSAVDITTAYTAGTVAQAGGGTATKGSQTAPQTLVDARTKLTNNKLPGSNRFTVLSPDQAGAFLKDDLFVNADKSGSTDGLRDAAIGRKFMFDNYESQVYSGLAAGVACHREALALVTRQLEMPMGKTAENAAIASYKGLGLRVVWDYDINAKQDVCSIDVLYGVKRLRPGGAVKLDLS
jgi:hypothetical protein